MRKLTVILIVSVLFLVLGAAPAFAATSKDGLGPELLAPTGSIGAQEFTAQALTDNIPGLPIPPSPFGGYLDHTLFPDDVYSIYLYAGQTLNISMTGGPATNFNIYLFAPGSTDVVSDHFLIAGSGSGYPKTFSYLVPAGGTGTYYLDAYAIIGTSNFGSYTITYSLSSAPVSHTQVWRFYKSAQGVHFYTNNIAEATDIYNNHADVYAYEGPRFEAYKGQVTGTIPVYRFYNFLNGVHFYTINWSEAVGVIETAAWTFRYEGIGYFAYPEDYSPSYIHLYRFYNFLQGAHFYTTSEIERDYLLGPGGNWTYRYEGVSCDVNALPLL